ncbi:hypothetical protein [Mycobacterium sp. 141]|uniref:hypothetical protein n=1 Tax=Mycobacterium sp. 141 TaxID=1120797 RepID=UPI0003632523|nr:hypothetical protein [Mycobacterium sp. 141]
MADHDRFDDGLSAFDFSDPQPLADDVDIDVLYTDTPAATSHAEYDTESDLAAFHEPAQAAGDEEQETMFSLFVVTNPPGTVSVTAAISGQLQQIQLSSRASRMTESELGHEILRTAAIALKKSQAGLNYFVYSMLVKQGMDHSSARNFVEFGMSLPSIQQAKEAEADFVAQYRRQ